ncbi:P-loop NTPase fold protein [Dactylosporangium sp. CA-092794]|uniref:P-loop NTPase fold protein n=1 Tax=Dactylosporangium sp. CA-092794 TaxID=3239929 RepID=UPI003D8F33C6
MTVADEHAASPPWLYPKPGGVGALVGWSRPDGTPRLASSGTDATVRLWDPEEGRPLGAPVGGHNASVLRLAALVWPGGTIVASADEDGAILVWDATADALVRLARCAHERWVQSLALWTDADGSPRLASASADGTLRLWDPRTGSPIGDPLIEHDARLAAVTVWPGPDGLRLAVGDDTGDIGVWDLDQRGRVAAPPMRHPGGLWTLTSWHDDHGSRIASAGHDGAICVWDPDSGQRLTTMAGHANWVPTLLNWTAPDGRRRVVSTGTDGTVRQWDAGTGEPLGAPIPSFGASMGTVALWTARSGAPRLAFVGGDGAIHSRDALSGAAAAPPLVGHVAGMWTLTSWRDESGTWLACGGDDGVIEIWSADTGRPSGEALTGHTAGVWGLASWSAGGIRHFASTGDDGTVRTWDLGSRRQTGPSLTGHAGWVPCLTTWHRADGRTLLVTTGIDGTVRRWDPASHTQFGPPIQSHAGWVLVAVTWEGPAGPRIASGGDDGLIRLWDAETGEPAGPPLAGHTDWVRALVIHRFDGRTVLISAGYDRNICLWDADTGEPLGPPLAGHLGQVAALAAWTAPNGRARLASAGWDGLIHIWDLESRRQLGEPLAGHVAGVWSLTSWHDATFGVRLASAGHDGTVRLWDPERGHAVRTVEIGPTELWGLSDAPTSVDVVGRQIMADAIADQLRRPDRGSGSPTLAAEGPTVIGVEGPWGSGKSTLMNLVRRALQPAATAPPAPGPRTAARHITVDAAFRQIRRYRLERANRSRTPAGPASGVVTAWFNPWAYQSGAQVWAGLTREIISAAAPVLFPTEPERERYWLNRNLDRVDRYALKRSLQVRTRSPIFRLTIVALVAPAVVAVAELDTPVRLFGHAVSPILLALGVAVLTMLAGVVHTLHRRRFGRAVDYLPSDFLDGPVTEGESPAAGTDDTAQGAADPLRHAREGALYLHQHDVGELIDDLAAKGYDLVVFVDDVDRCRPGTIAEVFEALNLFLSNVSARDGLRAHFVVGLDSSIVAKHLDATYGTLAASPVGLHGDDPSPGWAFLRKLIQLPVPVPQVPDEGVRRLVDAITGPEQAPPAGDRRSPAAAATGGSPSQAPSAAPPPAASATAARPSRRPIPAQRAPVDTWTWRSAERHPDVRALLLERLAAQPARSIREGKRLINVWQFYARVMDATAPALKPADLVRRSRLLIIVAEIVTRWPALHHALTATVDGRRGLQLLAAAVGDDADWQLARARLGLSGAAHNGALAGLRDLLRRHDGEELAGLAAQLM